MGLWITGTTAAIVAIPFATITLPPRSALITQAILILAVTLLLFASALRRGDLCSSVRGVPLTLKIATILWALATVIAGVVGLLLRNDSQALAGQALSMGLLPLGALAMTSMRVRDGAHAFATGIVGIGLVASLAHFGHWSWAFFQGQVLYRFYFHNNISLAAPSLLALLAALAMTSHGRASRRLGTSTAVILLGFIAGSGTRSLWAVTIPTLFLFVVSWRPRHWIRNRKGLQLAGGCVAAMALVAGGIGVFLGAERENVVPAREPVPPFWRASRGVEFLPEPDAAGGRILVWSPQDDFPIVVTDSFPVRGSQAYLLKAWLRSPSRGEARIFVNWETSKGVSDSLILRVGPSSEWIVAEQAGVSPPGSLRARIAVSLKHGKTGPWQLRSISLERLGLPIAATVHHQWSYWKSRLFSLERLDPRTWAKERSFRERSGETMFLIRAFAQAPLLEMTFGHGLGARFAYKTRWDSNPNYIHNFYAFLLYKTGIVGTVLVLAAMSLWIGFTFFAARRARGPWRRAFLWAVFSAWIGYAVWSLACPEILDFRMAPLWGFVIAVSGLTDREEREEGCSLRDPCSPSEQR